MKKTWIIAALLVVAGAGVYFYSQNKNATEVAEQATKSATSAAESASEAAAAAEKLAEEAAAKAVKEAAAAAEKAAEEAVEEAVAKAAEEAAAATTEPSMAESLLSPEGFDAGRVSEMIDGSDLDPLKKTMLKTAVEKAGDNPDMVKAVIEQIKGALGQ